MQHPLVTVVVTPRERFGVTQESLESLYDNTEEPFELIYVDGNSPPRIARYLSEQAEARGFRRIRTERYLTPNEARNLGTSQARTKYVAFVENDVIYTRGWLRNLVRCAEETEAAIVAPLICQGVPYHTQIHHAGGEYTPLDEIDDFLDDERSSGRREIAEKMYGHGEPLNAWDGRLHRHDTGFCEFHCVLVRRDIFDLVGPLDEAMLCTKEHIDFSMTVRRAGERVVFEPTSLVTYLFPNRHKPLEPSDWPFFLLRWSDSWEVKSLQHFRDKWQLRETAYFKDRYNNTGWRRVQGVIRPLVRRLPVIGRSDLLVRIAVRLIRPFEHLHNRLHVARHGREAGRTAATWTQQGAPVDSTSPA